MSGFTLGSAITPIVASYFLGSYGWQAGFYALAGLPLLVALPTVIFFVQESPVVRQAPLPSEIGWNARTAMQTRTFWTIFVVFLLLPLAVQGILIHAVPLVSDMGFGGTAAVAGVTILYIASTVARILAGFLLDVAFAPFVGAALFLASCLGIPILLFGHSLSAAYVGLALIGVAAGVETDVLGFLVSRYFGRRAFGVIYGLLFIAFMAGTAVGPYLYGLCFDALKSYDRALIWTGLGMTLGSILLATLPSYESVRPRRRWSETEELGVGRIAADEAMRP
jgi:MFS family permease